jgi:hypothetical protein
MHDVRDNENWQKVSVIIIIFDTEKPICKGDILVIYVTTQFISLHVFIEFIQLINEDI